MRPGILESGWRSALTLMLFDSFMVTSLGARVAVLAFMFLVSRQRPAALLVQRKSCACALLPSGSSSPPPLHALLLSLPPGHVHPTALLLPMQALPMQ